MVVFFYLSLHTHQIYWLVQTCPTANMLVLQSRDSKLSTDTGTLFSDGSLYRSLARALQYLTITILDISYVVQQVCLFMHAPREPHFQFLKRILR
ncbi:hypothetical protein HanIR_Chr06g0297821 [Helianthus annuus]|nr:hypothetical protein HanIR_Chr06g0297821 [Helianthus annuus]